MQAYAIERELGGAALDLVPRAAPVELDDRLAALPGEPDEDQADRFLRGAAAWPRQAGRADGDVCAQTRSAANRHRLGNRGTHRAVFIQERFGHAEQRRLD